MRFNLGREIRAAVLKFFKRAFRIILLSSLAILAFYGFYAGEIWGREKRVLGMSVEDFGAIASIVCAFLFFFLLIRESRKVFGEAKGKNESVRDRQDSDSRIPPTDPLLLAYKCTTCGTRGAGVRCRKCEGYTVKMPLMMGK